MVTRTYIDKNNTIIFGTQINTGRNPIAELYYGAYANYKLVGGKFTTIIRRSFC